MALQQHLKSRQKLLPTPFQFSTHNFKPMNSDQHIVATLLMMLHFQVCLVRTYVNLSKLSIFSKILERITVGGIISITIYCLVFGLVIMLFRKQLFLACFSFDPFNIEADNTERKQQHRNLMHVFQKLVSLEPRSSTRKNWNSCFLA